MYVYTIFYIVRVKKKRNKKNKKKTIYLRAQVEER